MNEISGKRYREIVSCQTMQNNSLSVKVEIFLPVFWLALFAQEFDEAMAAKTAIFAQSEGYRHTLVL
jgi:hypothetical protein